MKERATMIKSLELPVVIGREKSYYGKARVREYSDGEKILSSYNTDVCKIDSNGNFHRLWGGYSATTMRHINSFLALYGLDGGGKTWWNNCDLT